MDHCVRQIESPVRREYGGAKLETLACLRVNVTVQNGTYCVPANELHDPRYELAYTTEEYKNTYQKIWCSNATNLHAIDGDKKDSFHAVSLAL